MPGKATVKYVIEPFQFFNRRIHHGLADRGRFRKRKIKHVKDCRRIKSHNGNRALEYRVLGTSHDRATRQRKGAGRRLLRCLTTGLNIFLAAFGEITSGGATGNRG